MHLLALTLLVATVTDDNPRRIETIIEMLASKNEAPTRQGRKVVFPPSYKTEHQAVVYCALNTMLNEDESKLPILARYFNDERYAFTYQASSRAIDITVGNVCGVIFRLSICFFEPDLARLAAEQSSATPWKMREISQWYDENKDRGLRALQLEALATRLQWMRQVRQEDVQPPDPFSDELTVEEFERRRQINLDYLTKAEAMLQSLSRPAIPAKCLQAELIVGVPWRELAGER